MQSTNTDPGSRQYTSSNQSQAEDNITDIFNNISLMLDKVNDIVKENGRMDADWWMDQLIDTATEVGSTALLAGILGKAMGGVKDLSKTITKTGKIKITGDLVKDSELYLKSIDRSNNNINKWLKEVEAKPQKYNQKFDNIQHQMTIDMENTQMLNEKYPDIFLQPVENLLNPEAIVPEFIPAKFIPKKQLVKNYSDSEFVRLLSKKEKPWEQAQQVEQLLKTKFIRPYEDKIYFTQLHTPVKNATGFMDFPFKMEQKNLYNQIGKTPEMQFNGKPYLIDENGNILYKWKYDILTNVNQAVPALNEIMAAMDKITIPETKAALEKAIYERGPRINKEAVSQVLEKSKVEELGKIEQKFVQNVDEMQKVLDERLITKDKATDIAMVNIDELTNNELEQYVRDIENGLVKSSEDKKIILKDINTLKKLRKLGVNNQNLNYLYDLYDSQISALIPNEATGLTSLQYEAPGIWQDFQAHFIKQGIRPEFDFQAPMKVNQKIFDDYLTKIVKRKELQPINKEKINFPIAQFEKAVAKGLPQEEILEKFNNIKIQLQEEPITYQQIKQRFPNNLEFDDKKFLDSMKKTIKEQPVQSLELENLLNKINKAEEGQKFEHMVQFAPEMQAVPLNNVAEELAAQKQLGSLYDTMQAEQQAFPNQNIQLRNVSTNATEEYKDFQRMNQTRTAFKEGDKRQQDMYKLFKNNFAKKYEDIIDLTKQNVQRLPSKNINYINDAAIKQFVIDKNVPMNMFKDIMRFFM